MSPVEHTSDAELSPRTTISISRRIALAGIWGLLVALVGFGAVLGYGAMNPPAWVDGSPEANWGRGLALDLVAIEVGLVGLVAGAVFGGLRCFVPKFSASWLPVVGGLAVTGFATTGISAALGWERFIGWTWMGTCFAAFVFVFLLAFFLVGRTET